MEGLSIMFYTFYRINLDHAKEQVAKFASMDSNKDGSVTIQEFADYYRLPLSTPVRELFSVYDKVSEAGRNSLEHDT